MQEVERSRDFLSWSLNLLVFWARPKNKQTKSHKICLFGIDLFKPIVSDKLKQTLKCRLFLSLFIYKPTYIFGHDPASPLPFKHSSIGAEKAIDWITDKRNG